ncbi:MAG: MFS transporter [Planctomycetia bacterium]|nr:MFS transporter [Planctomycetia bacterium]
MPGGGGTVAAGSGLGRLPPSDWPGSASRAASLDGQLGTGGDGGEDASAGPSPDAGAPATAAVHKTSVMTRCARIMTGCTGKPEAAEAGQEWFRRCHRHIRHHPITTWRISENPRHRVPEAGKGRRLGDFGRSARRRYDHGSPPGPLMASPPEPLPPTVRALGWTSFLTDLSSEAIYPLLPGFVKGLGGTSLDIGLVDGVANAVAAVVRLPSGAVSDSIGRRPLILLGYGFSSVVRPLMGLVTSPLGVLLVRAADRFGKGIRTAPRDALVADLVEPEHRGRAFGHIRGLDHAGAAVGPLVAMLFLLLFPGRERTLFLLTILPGLATLAVIARFVRDAPRHTAAPRALAAGLSGSQAWLLACVALWAAGAASEQFLLLRAGELGLPAALIPLLWFAISLAKGVAASRAGPLAPGDGAAAADRRGRGVRPGRAGGAQTRGGARAGGPPRRGLRLVRLGAGADGAAGGTARRHALGPGVRRPRGGLRDDRRPGPDRLRPARRHAIQPRRTSQALTPYTTAP